MRRAGAFTLVELVIVMALLCVILGIAAPSLSRSMHQRNLNQEATRLLGVTEYARDEAVSRGVPMVVWVDVANGQFGVREIPGYDAASPRDKVFTLPDGIRFDPARGIASSGEAEVAEFTTDGTLDPSSQQTLALVDNTKSSIEIAQTSDGWGYQIVTDAPAP
jgi:prepilin-type N-terminal cleavage/methylation domain-containing protein